MKIKINNIGKINKAEILLNGITIVAGENNTGKSTIGKTLFALLHDMNEWESSYYYKCASELYNVIKRESEKLETFCLKNTGASRRRTNRANELIHKLSYSKEFIAIVEDFQILSNSKESCQGDACEKVDKGLNAFCRDYVSLYEKNSAGKIMQMNKTFFCNWISEMRHVLKNELELDEAILQANVLRNSFNHCFKSQYKTVFADNDESKVDFKDEDNEIIFEISKGEGKLSDPIRTKKGVYFVESPRLFDEIGRGGFMVDPRAELRRLMVPNSFGSSIFFNSLTRNGTLYIPIKLSESYEEEILSEEARNIIDVLVKEMNGQAEYYAKEGIKFKERDTSVPFYSQNVSTGLKALAFLEYAIRVGAIQKNDILILDEPEINLHPEWQVVYARALVLLQKAYKLTILITSHSPYFIRAIECFSDIYNTIENLNVYLIEKTEQKKYEISNVMESEYGMADLYEILSAPFDLLQEEINKKYSS